MTRKSKNTSEEQFVEDIGLYCEEMGMPRMAGRVLGRLLICYPPHQSMQDLANYLQASKGSISTSSRSLIQAGIMERVSFPKDRNDYYRIKKNVWSHNFKTQLDRIIGFKNHIKEGLKIMEKSPSVKKDRLLEMLEFHVWLEKQMPLMMQRWEKDRKKSR